MIRDGPIQSEYIMFAEPGQRQSVDLAEQSPEG
jgi:hypothetical protein